MFRQEPQPMDRLLAINNGQYFRQQPSTLIATDAEQPSDRTMHNKNFLSSNILLNRILEKRNVTRMPMGLNARNFYSNLDLMTIKWAASLNQRRCTCF